MFRPVFTLCTLLILTILGACASEPIDPKTSSIIADMSKRTDVYYQNQIKNFGTPDCRYSAADNRKFWASIDGDFKVLNARMAALPQLQEIAEPMIDLQQSLEAAQELAAEIDRNPDNLPNGERSFCLDPESAAQQWIAITDAMTLLSATANFN